MVAIALKEAALARVADAIASEGGALEGEGEAREAEVVPIGCEDRAIASREEAIPSEVRAIGPAVKAIERVGVAHRPEVVARRCGGGPFEPAVEAIAPEVLAFGPEVLAIGLEDRAIACPARPFGRDDRLEAGEPSQPTVHWGGQFCSKLDGFRRVRSDETSLSNPGKRRRHSHEAVQIKRLRYRNLLGAKGPRWVRRVSIDGAGV